MAPEHVESGPEKVDRSGATLICIVSPNSVGPGYRLMIDRREALGNQQ
jgi:hypothetical protein